MPLANVCMGMGGKGLIVGWVVETAKSKNGTTQIAEFRVAIYDIHISTMCQHSTTRPRQTCTDSGSNIRSPPPN